MKHDSTPAPGGYRTRSGSMRAQRANERRPVDLPATFSLAGGPAIEGRVVNISIGGAFIETDARAKFGEAVELSISLPTLAQPVRIEATVRWEDARGMGVQFGLMGARETHALTELLRRDSMP